MKRKLLTTTTIAVAVGFTLAATAMADDGRFGPGMHHDGDRWWGPFLFMVLLAAAAIAITWAIVRRPSSVPPAGSPPVPPPPTAHAEAILAERLARGEISPDDYRTMLAALREPVTPR
jgi:putative membrane protein